MGTRSYKTISFDKCVYRSSVPTPEPKVSQTNEQPVYGVAVRQSPGCGSGTRFMHLYQPSSTSEHYGCVLGTLSRIPTADEGYNGFSQELCDEYQLGILPEPEIAAD